MDKMRIFTKAALLAATLTAAAELFAGGRVITYPAPATEKARCSYTITANGKNVDIYRAKSPQFEGGEYFFAYFDFDKDVTIKVTSAKPLDKAELFPAKFKPVSQGKKSLEFAVSKPPFNATVLRDERNLPLVIFGNPIETDIPDPKGENVVFFGAGVHTPPTIQLSDNQTLYIAGGAVVKSRIVAKGKNITVRGRGILDGELFERFSIPPILKFDDCNNLTLRDFIAKDPSGWTLVMTRCDGVKIDNVKICGSRMLNDDAIDICNTSNVEIRNVFARAQDDIIAIKGMSAKSSDNQPSCNNILIENCTFWTDIANVFRIGFECSAAEMSNIRVRNIDIPFYAVNYRGPEEFWAKAIVWLQAANNMPIHNISFENIEIRANGNDMCMLLANPRKIGCPSIHKTPDIAGRVYDCSFKDIKVYGRKGKFNGLLYFKGVDANSDVKNITLENIEYFGEKIGRDNKAFVDEKTFTSGIEIK